MNVPKIPAMRYGLIGCAICGKPLRLVAATTENGGLPIHEECYMLRLRLKQATPPPTSSETPLNPSLRRWLLKYPEGPYAPPNLRTINDPVGIDP